jgi:hypothetical protein
MALHRSPVPRAWGTGVQRGSSVQAVSSAPLRRSAPPGTFPSASVPLLHAPATKDMVGSVHSALGVALWNVLFGGSDWPGLVWCSRGFFSFSPFLAASTAIVPLSTTCGHLRPGGPVAGVLSAGNPDGSSQPHLLPRGSPEVFPQHFLKLCRKPDLILERGKRKKSPRTRRKTERCYGYNVFNKNIILFLTRS